MIAQIYNRKSEQIKQYSVDSATIYEIVALANDNFIIVGSTPGHNSGKSILWVEHCSLESCSKFEPYKCSGVNTPAYSCHLSLIGAFGNSNGGYEIVYFLDEYNYKTKIHTRQIRSQNRVLLDFSEGNKSFSIVNSSPVKGGFIVAVIMMEEPLQTSLYFFSDTYSIQNLQAIPSCKALNTTPLSNGFLLAYRAESGVVYTQIYREGRGFSPIAEMGKSSITGITGNNPQASIGLSHRDLLLITLNNDNVLLVEKNGNCQLIDANNRYIGNAFRVSGGLLAINTLRDNTNHDGDFMILSDQSYSLYECAHFEASRLQPVNGTDSMISSDILQTKSEENKTNTRIINLPSETNFSQQKLTGIGESHQTSSANRNTPNWFSHSLILGALRTGFDYVRNTLSLNTKPTEPSIKMEEKLKDPPKQEEKKISQTTETANASWSETITSGVKSLFGVPSTTLKEHADRLNSQFGCVLSSEELLSQRVNQSLSLSEKLIAARYVFHYLQHFLPTMPWNRSYTLSENERLLLEDYQLKLQDLVQSSEKLKTSRLNRFGLYEDKFERVHNKLTCLEENLNQILKTNLVTSSLLSEIKNQTCEVEETIDFLARQNKTMKKELRHWEIQEERAERRSKQTGTRSTAVVDRDANGKFSHKIIRENSLEAYELAMRNAESQFGTTQQFWPKIDALPVVPSENPMASRLENEIVPKLSNK